MTTPPPPAAAAPGRATLVRAIGRWSLTATIVNSVVGSGIFGLPASVAGLVGAGSPLAVLAAGAGIFVIVLCFAEVASRFEDPGGPYLYTRAAFGNAVGFHVGWLHVWTRLLSGAAVLNVLASYVALVVPAAGSPTGRVVTMVGGMALVTAVNVIGVKQAAWTVNAFTVAKLLPLVALVGVGLFRLDDAVLATQAVASPDWTEAILLLVFAYGGFESGVLAAGETRNPRGDTAFALIAGMATVTLVYCLVQLTVVGVLPNAAADSAPVASAIGMVLGGVGRTLGGVAVVISVYGWLTGFALVTPRLVFAMGERHEIPPALARVHPRFRTPDRAIVVNSAIALGLGLFTNFTQVATLAAITRLGMYGLTCASLIALRRRGGTPGFVLPGGPVIAVLGVAFSGWLLTTRNFTQAWMLVALMLAGALLRAATQRLTGPAPATT